MQMSVSSQLRGLLALVCLAAAPHLALSQRPSAKPAAPASGGYKLADEASMVGTIVSYTENSKVPPLGTHVLLETASGKVDVHLGDARVLHQAKLSLAKGMSVRLVGQSETVGQNPVFLARLVQVGTKVVAVRSNRGVLVTPGAAHGRAAANNDAAKQGGAR